MGLRQLVAALWRVDSYVHRDAVLGVKPLRERERQRRVRGEVELTRERDLHLAGGDGIPSPLGVLRRVP